MRQWRVTDYLNKETWDAAVLVLKPFPLYKEAGWKDWSADAPMPFLLCCVLFTFAVYFWEMYLNARQLEKFRDEEGQAECPKGVSLEVFTKSLRYGADKLSFEMYEETFSLVWNLIVLLGGGLPWAWETAGRLGHAAHILGPTDSALFTECVQTCFFVLLFSLHDLLVSFPFSTYRTFVIEAKHGFNKQTFGLFVKDKCIGLLLTLVIGSPVLSGIVWLARSCGESYPLYVFAFMFVVSVVMMAVYPSLIAPLFNTYTELEEGKLRTAIYKLAASVSFPLKKLYTMDGSKRSSHSNAFFYGMGQSKMIVLFDTLLTQVSQEELLAILGHEIGHWRLWHTVQGFAISQLYTFCLFFSFSYMQSSAPLFSAFGFAFNGTDAATPVFVGLVLFMHTYWSPVEKALSFVLNVNSRHNEFAADEYSRSLGYGKDLSSGLVKISTENLGNMVPDALYSAYHFSHPPVVERCAAIADADKKRK